MKVVHAKAHGRVNLIGEHTDYNGGFVLPTAIPQFTEVTLTPRADQKVHIRSAPGKKGQTERDTSYVLGEEKKNGTWVDYLAGGTHLLLKDGFQLRGFDVQISSSVPEGSGLSSSAALEVAFLKALREAFALSYSDEELARLGQRIENEFVGAHVGIMDQMACTLARAGEALFLDTRNMNYEQIKLPLNQMDLLVINSGISHRNVGGGYNERRAQCEEACKILKISALRDLETKDLQRLDSLKDVLKRRARHVVTENARVLRAVAAIREMNLAELGTLFAESHASMRDDYEVSLPEIDTLVSLCSKNKSVFGARLTGGGFGGSIVAITKKGEASTVAAEILPLYQAQTGESASVLVQGDH